jgi:transposase-like protein
MTVVRYSWEKDIAMNVDLTNPIFHDETKAREHLEAARWPDGPYCPHCGSFNAHRMEGEKHRVGLLYCRDCRQQFSVTVGTVFERSHVPLNKWMLATYLLNASKKGISAHQLHRTIDVTYKTAWFMAHRIREAMDQTGSPFPLGGEGKIIEADEMYIGKSETATPSINRRGAPYIKQGKAAKKRPVVALVERGGRARAFHVPKVTSKNLRQKVMTHADRKSRLHTDESALYEAIGKEFATHETVYHAAKEYARGDVTTNSVEGFFGILRRGMVGVYQHCGEQHLQRYLNEFAFRYSYRARRGYSDTERAIAALKGIAGKRLTYRRINAA